MIKFFETVEVTLNRDVEVSDEFCPMDEDLFLHSGIFEESDKGDYEICTIKKGSHVFISMSPNGQFSITDSSGNHATLQLSDFNLPPNTQFAQAMKPVSGQTGIFSY